VWTGAIYNEKGEAPEVCGYLKPTGA
jgi:hypothetical protein